MGDDSGKSTLAFAGSRAPARKYWTVTAVAPVFCTVNVAAVDWFVNGDDGESASGDSVSTYAVELRTNKRSLAQPMFMRQGVDNDSTSDSSGRRITANDEVIARER